MSQTSLRGVMAGESTASSLSVEGTSSVCSSVSAIPMYLHVRVRICVCAYVCMQICLSECTNVCTRIQVCGYVYTGTNNHVQALVIMRTEYAQTFLFARACIRTHTHAYARIHTRAHTHAHTHTQTHTRTHTHISRRVFT